MVIITKNLKRSNTNRMENNITGKNKEWSLIQALFLLSILFLPFKISVHIPNAVRYLGMSCVIIGFALVFYAAMSLKENLKPSPKPRSGGYLVATGLYSIVRHPAYSGIIISALGYSLWKSDAVRFGLTGALCILFDYKSRIEEKWLEKSFPEYIDYKRRVSKKFIPGIY